jgi:hypothetical protein
MPPSHAARHHLNTNQIVDPPLHETRLVGQFCFIHCCSRPSAGVTFLAHRAANIVGMSLFSQATTGAGAGGAAGPGFPVEYKFYTEFQSHEAEFDFLKSVEIEEKINQICWCRGSNGALFLLSTNGTAPGTRTCARAWVVWRLLALGLPRLAAFDSMSAWR